MAYCRKLEVTLLSAKDLKNVNLIMRMEVYAVATISGNPLTRQCTVPDPYGGCHPSWNETLHFTVPPTAEAASGCLHILLRAERALGDRDVGEVIVPLTEILAGDGAEDLGPRPEQFASYQVRKVHRTETRGVLYLKYRLGPVIATQVPQVKTDPVPRVHVGMPLPPQSPVHVAKPPPPQSPVHVAKPPPPQSPVHVAKPPPPQAAGHVAVPRSAQVSRHVAKSPPPQAAGHVAVAHSPQASRHVANSPPPQVARHVAVPPSPQAAGHAAMPPRSKSCRASGRVSSRTANNNGNLDFGMGLGAGLVGGAIGGLLAGDMTSDASAPYNTGYQAGLANGGGGEL